VYTDLIKSSRNKGMKASRQVDTSFKKNKLSSSQSVSVVASDVIVNLQLGIQRVTNYHDSIGRLSGGNRPECTSLEWSQIPRD
jgi:hypothetical protein